ncbi:protein jagged-1-like [Haliotis rubra]|uniref:protein jagged-1-like n=1 Tax=Haliotis rubra TaxID=36100 RepID=UPI001EE5AECD|nr:protein jagged-1-like [Haliotis rubra]
MKTRGIHVALLLWLLIIEHVKTGGKLDIRFIRYSSGGRKINGECCDDDILPWCPDQCDPKFYLYIYGPGGGNSWSLYQSTTDYIHNHNIINFGSSIQGQANPLIIPVPKAVPFSIAIRVQVYDYDGTSRDDHMDTLTKLINIHAAPTEQTAVYTPYILRERTELEINVRAYCDTDWYGSACAKYCKATTNHSHYMCHLQTGAKMCFEGMVGRGDNCDQDIDECNEIDNTCQNGGSCRNTLGSFECICIEGIKGKRCENITNQCAVAPCLNGGTCGGNETAFNCACSVEWTGETCAEKVNFCDSAPCKRGNCTSDLLTATGFKCNCGFGWVGERCSLHVDIVNMALLGEIDHTNRGDLADGLKRVITELGGIPGKVDVKFTTNTQKENNFTTTYVQFYSAVENGSFIESSLLDEIFKSNPDVVINGYLPLPLVHMAAGTQTNMCRPFYLLERSEEVTDDNDQIDLFVINVPCDSDLNRAGSVKNFRKDASLCPEVDTSLDFDEAQVVTLDTVCNEISNTQSTAEDVTRDPLSIHASVSDVATPGTRRHVTSVIHPDTEDLTLGLVRRQGASVSLDDDGRHGDVTTLNTRRHVASHIEPVTGDMTLDPEGPPSFIVSPDDHAPLGDFGTPDTPRHVTSYTPLRSLPCTSGGGLPQTSSYEPLNRCEEEGAACAVVDDNNVEGASEENPYVDLVVRKR